ncbi:MAG: restriction endonuclease subunit S [Breznakia sp.]
MNQRTEIISPKENLNSNFAYVMLNGTFREKVKRIVQGGTQIYVNYTAVEKLSFELPSIDEQAKRKCKINYVSRERTALLT